MNFKRLCLLSSAISAICCSYAAIGAEDEEVVQLDTFVTEEEVTDDLSILQAEPVDSVFGFDKSILETPRAVSSISGEFLDQFNATGINDIVNFVPGTFTTSFFGVAGSLDIRGTSAENYFRGVKRLNNEGNYPTPIGATDRVDVIRGPMSPISGPSKVGGALNFIPKSARAETGQYMPSSSGAVGYTAGSWDRSIITAEVGGPMSLAGKNAGFYLYGELHDSGSYYNNDFTKMNLIQASFNAEITPSTRIAFGGMFQDWKGHENGGWNRVTQALIDDGTYVTGLPLNIDAAFGNNDGLMQESEIDDWESSLSGLISTGTPFTPGTISCFTGISVFCFSGNFDPLEPAKIPQSLINQMGMGLDPATIGTAKLTTDKVLITERDKYNTEVHTAYLDIIHDFDSGWNMTNKMFYDSQEYINVDSYGFTKIADAWVFEDQLIFSKTFEGDSVTSSFQFSPSYRFTDAFYALDFSDEIFDRTDLTKGFTAHSTQEVPSLAPDPGQESWSNYWNSEYAQYGLSMMSDTSFGGFNLMLGLRYDYVEAEGENGDGAGPVKLRTFDPDGEHKAENDDDGVTWTASLSYTLPGNITPYVTVAEQSTIVSGSAADLDTANIKNNAFLGDSELQEIGIKTSQLGGKLFAAVTAYEQERVAFNAQSPVSNQATNTEGYEFEMRYVPFERLALVGTYSNMEVKVINPGGVAFTYIGASDLKLATNNAAWYGGIIGGNIPIGEETLRGGIPETTYSMSASFKILPTLTYNLSFTSVDEVASSVLGSLVLPDYDLVNMSLVYETDSYKAGIFVNNITDETYFRGNFPSLYGNNAVLPELPRNWRAEVTHKF